MINFLAQTIHEASGRTGYWTRMNADKRRPDMIIHTACRALAPSVRQELSQCFSASKNVSLSPIRE